MQKCFHCGERQVTAQFTDIFFKTLREYWINMEAQVCQKCGFTCFTDAQSDIYQKLTQPFFDEYIAELKEKKLFVSLRKRFTFKKS